MAKKKKTGLVKAAGEGLKGFVDWTDQTVCESAKERETEMSSLASRFVMRKHKRAANIQEEVAPSFEGPDDKRSRQSDLEKDNHKSPKVIVVDSPKRAPD